MKAHRLITRAATVPYSPLYRWSSVRKRKFSILYARYGTSSKQATGNLPAKSNTFGLKIASEGLLPFIWKTLSVASSLINDITSNFSKAKNQDLTLKKAENPASDQLPKISSVKVPELYSSSLEPVKHAQIEPVKTIRTPEAKVLSPTTDRNAEELEQSFFDWLAKGDGRSKSKAIVGKEEQPIQKIKKPLISKSSLQQRSRFLVSSLADASSSGSQLLRLEEVCKHLLLYPEQKTVMCKAGLIRTALSLKYDLTDQSIQDNAQCVLALIGYHGPPRGSGMRILSIDGGGTRGIMGIEILRQLEALTNKKVYELFDYICGVSSGAILGLLLGGLRLSLDECESLYRTLSNEVFQQSTFWGTGRLMWSHAYYDTTTWVAILKKTFGEKLIIDTSKEKNSPKLAAVSAIMNLPSLEAFVFRNYDFPPGVQSHYKGSCRYRMWESIRASGAAPGYFQEYCLDDLLHQDGGIMVNNPTALAVHEARHLWPSAAIQCVVSIGCGRFIPPTFLNFTSTSLKTKVLKVIDSATDVQAVHIAMNDLLGPDTYFRLDPYMTEFLTLDENREEKLDQMKRDAQMYLRRNDYKIKKVAQNLSFQRSYVQNVQDWFQIQKDMIL